MAEAPGRYLSFENVSEDYDQTRVIPSPQLEEIVRVIAQEGHLERGGLFIDAGVGTGRFAAPLARLYPKQIIGVDIALAMMQRVEAKALPTSLSLARADLQRLPLREGVFVGALMVHILPLIERWTLVLQEIRRVLVPREGVLFLGGEQGSRSRLVNFYYQRALARRVLAPSLGSAGMAPALAYLRRPAKQGGAGAQVTLLETPQLKWKRAISSAETLEALAHRTYSQMWGISEDIHRELMTETRHYASQIFRREEAVETLSSRFVLNKVQWL